jgi:signal transduction histidine kinase
MVGRYDHEHCVDVVGGWSRAGNRLLDGRGPRLRDAAGALAVAAHEIGIRSSVGAPINVDGRIWGVLLVGSTRPDGIPTGTGHRLAEFTELVATAIANAQAREELQAIADDQRALQQLAALVARGDPPQVMYAAVAEQVGQLLPAAGTAILARRERDRRFTVVADWSGTDQSTGSRASVGGREVGALVVQTERPARIDCYADVPTADSAIVDSAVGAPITIDGRTWGVVLVTSTRQRPLPGTTEQRLAALAELIAPTIAHAQAHEQLRVLADEQAALRRVSQLISRTPSPAAVFAAVAEELGRLLPAEHTLVGRYNPDSSTTTLASWEMPGHAPTCSAAHRTTVSAPITAAGRLWGFVNATSAGDEPMPADAETRLTGLTELLGTAIAAAEAHTELMASRGRSIARIDQMRRRIERDLHDGAQQRLVSLALQLRTAQAAVPPGLDRLSAELDDVVAGMTTAMDELREYGRGIHPAILSEGLAPALKALARRSPVAVELDLETEGRPPEHVEVAAYYVVSEALTNTAKHAVASRITVAVTSVDHALHVAVHDNGVGGAGFSGGTGLVGLRDRVEAIGGRISLHSPPGSGTTLRAELPLLDAESDTSALG